MKALRQHWYLEAMIRNEIDRLGASRIMIPVVHPCGDVDWDEEREGLGRRSWTYGFLCPEGPPDRDMLASLTPAVERLQQRYDLGFTAD
jgi:hypothetical protein